MLIACLAAKKTKNQKHVNFFGKLLDRDLTRVADVKGESDNHYVTDLPAKHQRS